MFDTFLSLAQLAALGGAAQLQWRRATFVGQILQGARRLPPTTGPGPQRFGLGSRHRQHGTWKSKSLATSLQVAGASEFRREVMAV